jgi:hypothetical protein
MAFAPPPMDAPVRRRAFLGMLGVSGVMGALAVSLPSAAARRLSSLLFNGGKVMLDQLTCESFAPLLNSVFTLQTGSAGLTPARLVKAWSLGGIGRSRAGAREAFALRFHLPAASGLGQRIYALDHTNMGRLDLFLVPIRDDAGGLMMEAIFS